MFDRHEVGIALEVSRRDHREHTEAGFDAKRKDLGVADEHSRHHHANASGITSLDVIQSVH